MLISTIVQQLSTIEKTTCLLMPDDYYQSLVLHVLQKEMQRQNIEFVKQSVDTSSMIDMKDRLCNHDLLASRKLYVIFVSNQVKAVIDYLADLYSPDQKIIFVLSSKKNTRINYPVIDAVIPKAKNRMIWLKDCINILGLKLSSSQQQLLDASSRDDFPMLCHLLYQLNHTPSPSFILDRLQKQQGVFIVANTLLARQASIAELNKWLIQATVDQQLHLFRLHLHNIRLMLQIQTTVAQGMFVDDAISLFKINPWKAKEIKAALSKWTLNDTRNSLNRCIQLEQVQKGLKKADLTECLFNLMCHVCREMPFA